MQKRAEMLQRNVDAAVESNTLPEPDADLWDDADAQQVLEYLAMHVGDR